jgi:hypothetical protein
LQYLFIIAQNLRPLCTCHYTLQVVALAREGAANASTAHMCGRAHRCASKKQIRQWPPRLPVNKASMKKKGGCTQILQKQQKADNPWDKPLHKKCTKGQTAAQKNSKDEWNATFHNAKKPLMHLDSGAKKCVAARPS